MISKVKKFKSTYQSCRRYHSFVSGRKKPVVKKTVFIESKHGEDLAGNMFYLLKELSQQNYTCYLVYHTEAKERISQMLKHYQIKNVTLVLDGSTAYAKRIATCEFLVTDTSFPIWFSRREGQKILNTWHGTPLKKMGREVCNQSYVIGNVQKNFQMADALLFPSEYMKEKMISAYCLENTFKNTCYLSGYPRNAVFFQKERANEVKKELSIADKKIYAYMPTWRGILGDTNEEQVDLIKSYLLQLDQLLEDSEVFYVKLHLFFNNVIDYSQYRHIKPFPAGYETYDFLNCADVLVTDYSSVFFDFANTRKKIVLFTYDEETYVKERGWYLNLSELPFPRTPNIEGLVKELRSAKEYDDQEFLETYCTYDNVDATQLLIKDFFEGDDCLKKTKNIGNGKKNVMIYCGNLALNGITTSLLNYLSLVDLDRFNYFVFTKQGQFRNNKSGLDVIADQVGLLLMSGSTAEWTICDAIAHKLFVRYSLNISWARKRVENMYQRAYQDRFSFCGIDEVIQFTGYTPDVTMMLSMADCHKMIFAHNDMYEEYQEKKNFNYNILNYAYNAFDKILCVSEAVKASIKKFGAYEDKTVVVYNPHNADRILKKAKEPLFLEEVTELSVTKESFRSMLASTKKKFITMGRFSEEKGHYKLIDAFDAYYEKNPDTVLIILGGYGKLYEQTKAYAASKKSGDAIYLGMGFKNPFPVLTQCDLFLLPSDREPLGLVLLEADTLNVPIVATDIPGSGDFLKEHHGFLVPNSVEGLSMGMEAWKKGEVHPLNIKFDEYNRKIIEQFEALLDK